MHARLTSQSYKRPFEMVVVLFMFALMSTGLLYFYWLAGLMASTWLFKRLARESFGVERFMLRCTTQMLSVVTCLTGIWPMLSLLPEPIQERIMTIWLWAGWAAILFLAVQIWRSPRWSRRRGRWVSSIATASVLAAGMVLGEGNRRVLMGSDYRHSRRIATIGLAATYGALYLFVFGRLSIEVFESDWMLKPFMVFFLSLTMWFGVVLYLAMLELRTRTKMAWPI